ncbi:hypothetical protein FKP32DRAFT_972964 [Trametes sanguinea]|nr:hypothetical protein FKP32DRAFT_972964 [Trametes sanguinea]
MLTWNDGRSRHRRHTDEVRVHPFASRWSPQAPAGLGQRSAARWHGIRTRPRLVRAFTWAVADGFPQTSGPWGHFRGMAWSLTTPPTPLGARALRSSLRTFRRVRGSPAMDTCMPVNLEDQLRIADLPSQLLTADSSYLTIAYRCRLATAIAQGCVNSSNVSLSLQVVPWTGASAFAALSP